MTNSVVIIGGGLAGLTCAKQLHAAGVEFILLEASDGVGGRVRTDEVDGFLLDRGFQVLLTAYPEATRLLDYDALNLQAFEPGSLIRTDSRFQKMSDPCRRPQHALQTAFASIGDFADKLRIGYLRWAAGRGDVQSIFQRPDHSTEEEWKRLGFTAGMVEKFLRPFLGGIFLDHDLQTSCRMLYFVFRMFSQGDTVLPAAGMGAIPQQLAAELLEDCIRPCVRLQQTVCRYIREKSFPAVELSLPPSNRPRQTCCRSWLRNEPRGLSGASISLHRNRRSKTECWC